MKNKYSMLLLLFTILFSDLSAAKVEDKIAGLYIAYFNRAADKSGFDYWKQRADVSEEDEVIEELSRGFSAHPKYTQLYNHLEDQEFIESIYSNVLDNEGDIEGIEFWKDTLSKGKGRANMVANFVSLALDFNASDPQYDSLSQEDLNAAQERKNLIANKVEIALEYINTLGNDTNLDPDTDLSDASELENDEAYLASVNILSNITHDEESKNSAKNLVKFLANNKANSKGIINRIKGRFGVMVDDIESVNDIMKELGLNQLPIADAGEDQIVELGETVYFDASGSSDDTGIVSYEWQLDDVVLSNELTFAVSDFDDGKHKIKLIVVDNDGSTNTDTVTIIVGEYLSVNEDPKGVEDKNNNNGKRPDHAGNPNL